LLLYVDVDFGEVPESKEITYAKLLYHVDVELSRYLNVKKGHMIDCYFMWMWSLGRDKWVSVTTAWHILRLRMEERPSKWTVAANILNM